MTRWASLILLGLATPVLAEPVDFYCGSPLAVDAYVKATYEEVVDPEEFGCAFFTTKHGFLANGELTKLSDIDTTDHSVYLVDFPNGIQVYTFK